jgi:hypothetical protein
VARNSTVSALAVYTYTVSWSTSPFAQQYVRWFFVMLFVQFMLLPDPARPGPARPGATRASAWPGPARPDPIRSFMSIFTSFSYVLLGLALGYLRLPHIFICLNLKFRSSIVLLQSGHVLIFL